jgi:hypothetical protein
MIFYLPLDPFKPAVVKFYSTKPVSHLALPDLFTGEDLANSLAVTVYKTALSAKSCISSRLH